MLPNKVSVHYIWLSGFRGKDSNVKS